MIFSSEVLIRAIIAVLGACGFFLAAYIRNKKKEDAPLVCMVGFDCHAVVHSDYSKFLGIPVEILGMLYYALIAILYGIFIVTSYVIPVPVVAFLILMSLSAIIFSIYLIGVQLFVLKKGCSWCIVSAIISATIFVLTMTHYELSVLAELFTR